MAKFIKYPFALAGDKTPIPNTIQIDGSVSYTEGWGIDYAKNASTQVLCDLTGDPFTLIPAGSSVVMSDSGYSFQLLAPVTLNGLGIATNVLFQSMTTGFVAAPAGTVQTIVFGVPGWNTVTNPAPSFIDTSAKKVPRNQSNQVLFDISDNTNQYQTHGFPNFITTVDNDGSPYPYDKWAVVRYDSGGGFNLYQSIADSNVTLPTNTTFWRQLTNVFQTATQVYIENITFDISVLNNDVVAWNPSTNKFVGALGDGTFTGLLIGMADVPNFRVLLLGEVTGPFYGNDGVTPQNLVGNTDYYMANTIRPGHITQTPSDPNFLVKVGVARSSNVLFFNPQIIDSARGQLFTASGSFTVPFNTEQVLISGNAGGGGGGGGGYATGGANNCASGGGGGGGIGGMVKKQRLTCNPGDILTITIGAGGSGGPGGGVGLPGSNGSNGSNTSVGLNAVPVITLTGGIGGSGSGAVSSGSQLSAGASGGSSSAQSGDIGIVSGNVNFCFSGTGGMGGSGLYSSPGRGGQSSLSNISVNGASAPTTTGFGGGGGGGSGRAAQGAGQSGSGGNGGAGSAGFILIEW